MLSNLEMERNMSGEQAKVEKKSWGDSFKSFSDARSLTMLLLGFSAGLPILMIFSSLGLWLREPEWKGPQ